MRGHLMFTPMMRNEFQMHGKWLRVLELNSAKNFDSAMPRAYINGSFPGAFQLTTPKALQLDGSEPALYVISYPKIKY